jgi:hypothetical protein
MAMKQTQTKLFDLSDVGLGFCAGSKNLFPDRFKKMLSLGYNVQTVSSVAVAGNQVTFTYGGAHGYVADRVLRVDSGDLASINGGEFWIDSITTNTITFTLDGAPSSVTGDFTTHIASLGWQLVYEQAYIHIYKFKHIDDTDMYARLCFQSVAAQRNCIAVGIGRTADLTLGVITDSNCLADLQNCATPADATSSNLWDFTVSIATTYDNYTYSQGYGVFGKGVVVGSIYHFVCMYSQGASSASHVVSALLPFSSKYNVVNYPVIMCQNNGVPTSAAATGQLDKLRLLVGSTQCASHTTYALQSLPAKNSYLPSLIDEFNTTTIKPLDIYTTTEFQFLGFAHGLGVAMYATTTTSPAMGNTNLPTQTVDVEFDHIVHCHALTTSNTSTRAYVGVAVEPINGI